jgi:cytochrome d ubiquinol oxidase subunit II
MAAIWFAIVSGMLAAYAVLDGFDLGVGIVHRIVARTDAERRAVLAAIGPVWDGNEVWLIAAGGVLFMAFPSVYATAFGGFYLALMVALWLLILRGVAIESRAHQENPLWRELWDSVFAFASTLLVLTFGAALGNLVRGVPLDSRGLRGMPFFTTVLPGPRPGILDVYTGLVALLAAAALAGHGALYLAWRTDGLVRERSLAVARVARWISVALWAAVTAATAAVQPGLFASLAGRPWSVGFVTLSIAGMWGVFHFPGRGRARAAFVSSCAFVLGLVATALAGNYPYWLRSTVDPSLGLTAPATLSARYGMGVALGWCAAGIALVGAYYVLLIRSMRRQVDADPAESSRPQSRGEA